MKERISRKYRKKSLMENMPFGKLLRNSLFGIKKSADFKKVEVPWFEVAIKDGGTFDMPRGELNHPEKSLLPEIPKEIVDRYVENDLLLCEHLKSVSDGWKN